MTYAVVGMEQYKANLGSQVAEVEMLESMFPGPGELQMEPGTLHSVTAWIEGPSNCEELPPAIELTLVLESEGKKLDIVATLPPEYPTQAGPEVYVRAEKLSRTGQANINRELSQYLSGDQILVGEPCLVSLVSWLQENGASFFTEEQKVEVKVETKDDPRFLRFWVYSHHIYSKIKRKDLQDLASELKLTGFVMPGKPGIICVEGSSDDVNDWWGIVRNWQWKHIKLKVQEEEEGETDAKRIFTGFQEIGVLKECQRGNHMDMGEFQKYLQQHNVHWVFKELFGIDRS